MGERQFLGIGKMTDCYSVNIMSLNLRLEYEFSWRL